MDSKGNEIIRLSEEQLEQVQDLAGCNYSPRDIAIYLDCNENEFVQMWKNPESIIRYHYERGVLIAKADIEMKTLQQARGGNTTAGQIWNNAREAQRFENLKTEIFYDGGS